MRISLIGQPGAGKSTLARILSGIFNTMYISSGDLARAHGFAGSDAEKSGQLDPDENKIRRLVKNAIGTSDQYILDGFPRTIDQISDLGIPLDAVLYLNMPGSYGVSIGAKRLLDRGRPDDTITTIAARIATYFTYTYPLVQHFLDEEKLIYINANGTIANTLRQAVVQMAARGIVEASMYVDKLVKEFEYDYTLDPKSAKIHPNRKTGRKGKTRRYKSQ